MEDGQVILTADDGREVVFYVLEQAEIAGQTYLLVADSMEEEAEALMLKQIVDDEIITYDVVDDDNELKIIAKYFEELLEDVNLELE